MANEEEADLGLAASASGEHEAAQGRRRAPRKLSRRIRHAISQALVRVAGWILPWLYVAYCWLVWKTSRIDDGLTGPLRAGLARHDRFVALLWHQEVFTVAWAYRHLRGHTLASTGNFGHVVTKLLELCNFTVFRGGSSRGTARRQKVLPTLIRHMREHRRVPYGITVDGSNGPAFRMKHGGPMIARACQAPVYLVRLACRRRIVLPTWDRTVIPLPFNRIEMLAIGPYWLDPADGSVEFQRAVTHLEEDLQALAWHVGKKVDPAGLPALEAAFGPGWSMPWQPGAVGRRNTRWDLRPESPPPWASCPPETPAQSGG